MAKKVHPSPLFNIFKTNNKNSHVETQVFMRPAAGMQQQPTDNSQQSLFILFYERLMLKRFYTENSNSICVKFQL